MPIEALSGCVHCLEDIVDGDPTRATETLVGNIGCLAVCEERRQVLIRYIREGEAE